MKNGLVEMPFQIRVLHFKYINLINNGFLVTLPFPILKNNANMNIPNAIICKSMQKIIIIDATLYSHFINEIYYGPHYFLLMIFDSAFP